MNSINEAILLIHCKDKPGIIAGVTHHDDVESLVRKGRDLETLVLSRAVWKHIQRKTLVTENRTIIFNQHEV